MIEEKAEIDRNEHGPSIAHGGAMLLRHASPFVLLLLALVAVFTSLSVACSNEEDSVSSEDDTYGYGYYGYYGRW
jgi:hypothetical protein